MLRRDSIAKILQINVRVSSSLGHPYIIQLAAIYERMLQARPFHCCARKTLVDAHGSSTLPSTAPASDSIALGACLRRPTALPAEREVAAA